MARPLDAEDLERLAITAYLEGRDDESAWAWHRAESEHVRLGRRDRAARCAFWQGFALLLRGEPAQANGWLARAERLVEASGEECAARGFLLVPPFLQALKGDADAEAAERLAGEMLAIAGRCDDKDLMAFALLCSGEAALALADGHRGMKLLDEAMVSVTTGEVSPIPAGVVYCAVIESCMEVFDLRRAAEWTEALHTWCGAQPGLVPFRGQCLVHRSQVLQAHGRWTEAVTEAERARALLSAPAHPALGVALYQRGELHRLRGEFADAELAYRAAEQHGREPMPGLALLRLAEGRPEDAVAAVRRATEQAGRSGPPPAVLAAAVEVHLAVGELASARSASDALASMARGIDVPLLHAMADHATGSVLLAEDDPRAALTSLRRASRRWRELAMPYDGARTGIQIALASRMLGDDDAAELELAAARATFERMEAGADLARATQLAERHRRTTATLTDRECEVLRLVATGRTNRQIAAALGVSEHTVARHLQNIFLKLDLPSRSAATAYAYEHRLI